MFRTKSLEKIKTHKFCSVTFFRKSYRLWDNVEKIGRARQVTDDVIWRMRLACWITKATETHSEYVILIAFSPQQWLNKRASILCYAYIALLVTKTDTACSWSVSVGLIIYHTAHLWRLLTLHWTAVCPIDYETCHCRLLSAINCHFVRLQKLT
jgi:hypothetical protein